MLQLARFRDPVFMLGCMLAVFASLIFASAANAENGDGVCASLYVRSGAIQGSSSCYDRAWGNTSINLATHYCVNEPSRIKRWCATPPDGMAEASCPVADPVDSSTGSTTLAEYDFVSGDDTPMVFRRTYRAQPLVRPDAGLGALWLHNWQRQLNLANAAGASSLIVAYREDGHPATFNKVGGIWRALDGTPLALTQDASGWALTDLTTGSIESYSGQGVLLSINDVNRRTTTLTYSDANTPGNIAPASGLLIAITQHAANTSPFVDLTLRLSYDAKWRVTQMTDPIGSVIQYGYDGSNNLVSVTWPNGSVRRYLYEDTRFSSALTGVIDETGSRIATWAYDAKGRATEVSHPDTTRNVQFAYGNGTTSVTGNGRTTALSFSSIAGVMRPTGDSAGNSSTWDSSGKLLSDARANGKSVEYTYDEVNRPTRAVTRDSADTAVTSVRYADATSLRPLLVALPGRMRAYVYDPQGNLIGLSELTTNDPSGASGFNASTSGGQRTYGLAYNGAGQLYFAQLRENDVLTGEWSITRDVTGNVRTILDRATGDAIGVLTRDAAHRPVTITGPGFTANPTYDVRGRLSTFLYMENAGPVNGNVRRSLTVSYSYSADGRVVSRTGTVSTDHGPETSISSDEIDQWLDNYEAGIAPAGPPVNLSGWVRALRFAQEAGLEPVCIECFFTGPRAAWLIYKLAKDPVVEVIQGGIKQAAEAKQCKPTQASIDELMDAATKSQNETGLSKLSRAWDKHSGRDAEYYPPLTGNVEAKNATTEGWLRDLLEDPATTRQELSRGGSEYRASNGTGARYDSDGSFVGVLNPKVAK